ncbi:Eco57I restriction-modification methylase domain-containing protein [Sphingomonas parapaucimobilis]|uniref:Eco57I restriction-modification methylase domain-containing protein n=1 Tax=Sphingomonas parapaucimobilis TaxID=28213 RepID=UPI0039E7AF18
MSGPIPGGRHDWIGYLQPVGLVVAPAALARIGLWLSPQGPADGEAVTRAVAGFADDPWSFFHTILGWPANRVLRGETLPDALRIAFPEQDTLLEPHGAIPAPDGTIQLLVRIETPELILDKRGTLPGWEATAQERFERLLRETGVGAGVIVGACETGRKDGPATEPVLRLVVVPRGEASGHISWPLARLGDVSGRPMLAGLKLLLDAHALFSGPPSHRLPAILAESRAAQAEVSSRLAGQVLAGLHEMLRGLDAADGPRIRALADGDPDQLYKGLLTVLLRLVFILYAEDRGLMPSAPGGMAAALYEQGYALGGLHLRLRDDAALYPDTMDERRGAWGRLLALFRLVDRGHPSGFMQARGGQLFREAAFPFLLGRDTPDAPEQVLPVGDGYILRMLDSLLMLKGERVAYRALSVEQIGSVYEAVMGFTVQCAASLMLAVRAGKGNKVPVWVDLEALAAARPSERERALKLWTGRAAWPAAVSRSLREAGDATALAAALAPVADARAAPRGPVAAGTPILQPTDERRRTGSHYTPASLTRPIVAHALAPAFARIGPDAGPGQVLDLKVCDPAAGSGAFLVEACRQLGERLVAAWTRWPDQRPTIPADEDDLLHAKRLVAQHCLRGVDRNPLAIDLAKLSLWLETLASAHEFTFLDAVLRCGDSLVGLPNPNIIAVTWDKVSGQQGFVEAIVREGIDAAAQLRRLMRVEAEIAPYAVQEQRHRAATLALERAQLVADGILWSYFTGAKARERTARLAEVQQCVLSPSPANWARLQACRDELRRPPIDVTPFHWELEFEDVFNRPDPGFDAIVGNPPFAGKNTIAAGHAAAYPDWLKTLHPGAHGNADLAAHFFRRAYGLLRRGGAFGLIATNTIRQGDTRETGLARILAEGGTIFRAVSRYRWEGEAAVVVAQVFVSKGPAGVTPVLDDRPVRRISAYLMEGDLDGSPAALRENAGKAFQGAILLGAGFTFDDQLAASGKTSPIADLNAILSAYPDHRPVVRPYIGGQEVNNSPTHTPRRFAMNLSHLAEQEARDKYPHFLAIIEAKVRADREALPPTNAWNRDVAKRWWQFAADRRAIAAASAKMSNFIVHSCGATPHIAFAIAPSSHCFANTLAVLAFDSYTAFATLQSRVHEVWARFFASTLEDRLRYTPSDCFETFPLPPGYAESSALEAAGQAYHDHRAALMIARDQGMTPTYNRFHRTTDTQADIATLRDLHHAMDRAVLAAYGWDDLAAEAAPVFLDAESEDDHRYQGRLFWPAPFRDAVLARLLKLNEERVRMERML